MQKLKTDSIVQKDIRSLIFIDRIDKVENSSQRVKLFLPYFLHHVQTDQGKWLGKQSQVRLKIF